jgi:hypothetical protein
MVVLDALFWLQSRRTLPGRRDLVIWEVTKPGWACSSACPRRLASSLASWLLIPLIFA